MVPDKLVFDEFWTQTEYEDAPDIEKATIAFSNKRKKLVEQAYDILRNSPDMLCVRIRLSKNECRLVGANGHGNGILRILELSVVDDEPYVQLILTDGDFVLESSPLSIVEADGGEP